MGVPKFYRWLSERYPCLSEVINDAQIPEFDNLYLDMNGIIHNCSHPNDDDVTFRISEEQIFLDIFKYIENLFRIIKPQKVFFMAVDGVAPRAKMNQQRARRFMSAKNADSLLEKAKRAGEEIPDDKRFDSNCITPGTQFMVELNRRLGEWVQQKIDTDARWRGLRIYLSGHDCPGEGEHKIMDFIRTERAKDGYDPNTRHCMYGLDADLIMLGMCSHEPHFSLLREEVKFSRPHKGGGGKKAPPKLPSADSITFHLLHLSLLREYLAWEFIGVKDSLSFDYDMERIIDDWVLMGFLIGNDFIPHLPNVHIHDDALPLLYRTYMSVLPTLDGYINENGILNLPRFQKFLTAISRNDRDSFLQQMEDEEYLASKMGRCAVDNDDTNGDERELVAFNDSDMSSTSDEEDDTNEEKTSDGEAAFQSSDEDDDVDPQSSSRGGPSHGVLSDGGIGGAAELLAGLKDDDPMEDEFSEQLATLQFREMDDAEFQNNVDNCWTKTINNDFKRHKKRYYSEKLKMGNISKGQLREQAEGYVRAIQWNLHYYYHGCCSWNWYFRHHYAPYISDVLDFSSMEMGFEMSQPFHPFEQLLAVLPAASAECLPRPLRDLMCNHESPIADFYPTDFKTDLNGKKNDWEAVVLIPFIDEKRLLEAIQSKEPLLSKEDAARNVHGGHRLFTARDKPESGKWCKLEVIDKDTFRIPKETVVHGLLPNVKLDVFFPGFPTMKHLPHKGQLRECHAKVFNMASRKPSMLLSILPRPDLEREISEIASDLLGEEVCVEWPVLKVAMVEEIWTETRCYKRWYNENGEAEKNKFVDTELDANEKKLYSTWRRDSKDRLMERYAIEPGTVTAMARVRRLLGTTMVIEGDKVVPRRQWTPAETAFAVPLQLVCLGVLVNDNISRVPMSIKDAFPIDSKVFVMDPKWAGYGQPALIKEIQHPGSKDCRVVVQYALSPEPDLRAIRSELPKFSLSWFDALGSSRQSGIDRGLIARLTGTVFLMDCTQEEMGANGSFRPPRLNIGLNLKSTKRSEETPDYARKQSPESTYWMYSLLTLRIFNEYRNKFREVFTYLEKNNSMDDTYYSGDIWPNAEKRTERMNELKEWLESLPCHGEQKQKAGEEYLDRIAVAHVESIVASTSKERQFRKSIVVPAMLFRPALNIGGNKVRPDPDANFLILDRVTFAQDAQQVPFGLTGTVIGKHGNDHVDVLFDCEFPTGVKMRSSTASCARVLVSSLINITYAKERKLGNASAGNSRKNNQSRRQHEKTAPPSRLNTWEEKMIGGDKKKEDKRSRRDSEHSKGSNKDKEAPPATVAKLLRNVHAAKTVAGISVNDNVRKSKAQKTQDAEELLNYLTGATSKMKKQPSAKEDHKPKKTDSQEGSLNGNDAGKAILAMIAPSPSSSSSKSKGSPRRTDASASASAPVTSRSSTHGSERPSTSSSDEKNGSESRNRKERRRLERLTKEEEQTALAKVWEEEKEQEKGKKENKNHKNTVPLPRPVTTPMSKDMLKLLGLTQSVDKAEEDERKDEATVVSPSSQEHKSKKSDEPDDHDDVPPPSHGTSRAAQQFWGPSRGSAPNGRGYGRPPLSINGMGRGGPPPPHIMPPYGAPPPHIMAAMMQQQQQQMEHQHRQNNYRGGRGGRYMKPDEYVKDKVTDLTPASVSKPLKSRGRGGTRGGMTRGAGKPQLSPSETAVSSSIDDKCEQSSPLEQSSESTVSSKSTQPKTRKPRIAAKLSVQ